MVRARFEAGSKELLMGTAQTVLLLAFNNQDRETLSFSELLDNTGLPAEDLVQTLQSLVSGKVKLLKKRPKVR